MGKVKCSGVYLSPVHRKAEGTSGPLVISGRGTRSPLPCLSAGWVYVGPGLVSAQPSEKNQNTVQKDHSLGVL